MWQMRADAEQKDGILKSAGGGELVWEQILQGRIKEARRDAQREMATQAGQQRRTAGINK